MINTRQILWNAWNHWRRKRDKKAHRYTHLSTTLLSADIWPAQYGVILLGGLSGRLDQTIHTLSYLHKLRRQRERVFCITDDNIAWVLDEVRPTSTTHILDLNVNGCRENIIYMSTTNSWEGHVGCYQLVSIQRSLLPQDYDGICVCSPANHLLHLRSFWL